MYVLHGVISKNSFINYLYHLHTKGVYHNAPNAIFYKFVFHGKKILACLSMDKVANLFKIKYSYLIIMSWLTFN